MEADAEASLRHIWKVNPGLRYGYGLYVMAAKTGNKFIPWYVGKTDRTFGSRLNGHRSLFEVSERTEGRPVHLSLMARITPKNSKIVRSKVFRIENGEDYKVRRKKNKLIDRLEYALIEKCVSVNPDLLNVQLRKLQEGVSIPGFIGQVEPEDSDKSSKMLHRMLTPE